MLRCRAFFGIQASSRVVHSCLGISGFVMLADHGMPAHGDLAKCAASSA